MGTDLPHCWLDGWTSAAQKIESPNFGPRPVPLERVDLLVVHSISLPPGQFENTWVELFFQNQLPVTEHPYFATIAELQVSSHFYIRRDGHLIQFVSCDQRAWHAGISSWQGISNCNDFSIGIELEGGDELPYECAQYETLISLANALKTVYPVTQVAGHCHIAPGRKTDPGPYFDWSGLR